MSTNDGALCRRDDVHVSNDTDVAAAAGRSARPHSHHRRSASSLVQHGDVARTTTSKPIRRDWPFDSTFTSRGFDAETDPFASTLSSQIGTSSLTSSHFETATRHNPDKQVNRLAVAPTDDWFERLGAKATSLERHGEARARTFNTSAPDDEDEEEEDDGDDGDNDNSDINTRYRQGNHSARLHAHLSRAEPARLDTKNLAIWRDDSESAERTDIDFDYFQPTGSSATSPFSSPALSRARLPNMSKITSSHNSMTKTTALASPPLPQSSTKRQLVAHAEGEGDLDEITHSFLASQDRSGVFGKLERALEWTWSPSSSSNQKDSIATSTSLMSPLLHTSELNHYNWPRSAPLTRSNSITMSRVTSSHSLAWDHFNPVELEDSAWTERGELSAYAQARRQQAREALTMKQSLRNHKGLDHGVQWAEEPDELEHDNSDMYDANKSRQRSPMRGHAASVDRTESASLREGLSAILDSVGLGNWV
ncbi:hypothetical protein OIO90_003132 [Microbotryomycetes sp. JL221]|nr:hypothetical protein OIO90_003132 [Microbotryomycetes sp. JL221]